MADTVTFLDFTTIQEEVVINLSETSFFPSKLDDIYLCLNVHRRNNNLHQCKSCRHIYDQIIFIV